MPAILTRPPLCCFGFSQKDLPSPGSLAVSCRPVCLSPALLPPCRLSAPVPPPSCPPRFSCYSLPIASLLLRKNRPRVPDIPEAIRSIQCWGFVRPDSLPFPSPNLAAEPVARWQRREGRIYSPTLVAGLFFCCFCLSVSDRSLVASLARSLSSHWFMVPSAVVGQQPAFVQPIATRLFAADHPTIQPSSHPAIHEHRQRGRRRDSSAPSRPQRRQNEGLARQLFAAAAAASTRPSLTEAPSICGILLPDILQPSPNHHHRHRTLPTLRARRTRLRR